MRLMLVRHGESTWNAQGRYQGRMDPPLSDRGRAQAQALAQALDREQSATVPDARIRRIVASPLERARETARLCAEALQLKVEVDDRLIEISHGQWEGLLRAQIAARWPQMLEQWQTTPALVTFPDGESLAEVAVRFDAFVAAVRGAQGAVLAVTHDVIVRIATLRALGKPLDSFNDISVDNAAVNEFVIEETAVTIARRNDTSHLGTLRSDVQIQAL
jgi:phosphoserine phosphatase